MASNTAENRRAKCQKKEYTVSWLFFFKIYCDKHLKVIINYEEKNNKSSFGSIHKEGGMSFFLLCGANQHEESGNRSLGR